MTTLKAQQLRLPFSEAGNLWKAIDETRGDQSNQNVTCREVSRYAMVILPEALVRQDRMVAPLRVLFLGG